MFLCGVLLVSWGGICFSRWLGDIGKENKMRIILF